MKGPSATQSDHDLQVIGYQWADEDGLVWTVTGEALTPQYMEIQAENGDISMRPLAMIERHMVITGAIPPE